MSSEWLIRKTSTEGGGRELKGGEEATTKVNNLCTSFAGESKEKCLTLLVLAGVLTITGIGIWIALTVISYSKWTILSYNTQVGKAGTSYDT